MALGAEGLGLMGPTGQSVLPTHQDTQAFSQGWANLQRPCPPLKVLMEGRADGGQQAERLHYRLV